MFLALGRCRNEEALLNTCQIKRKQVVNEKVQNVWVIKKKFKVYEKVYKIDRDKTFLQDVQKDSSCKKIFSMVKCVKEKTIKHWRDKGLK